MIPTTDALFPTDMVAATLGATCVGGPAIDPVDGVAEGCAGTAAATPDAEEGPGGPDGLAIGGGGPGGGGPGGGRPLEPLVAGILGPGGVAQGTPPVAGLIPLSTIRCGLLSDSTAGAPSLRRS